ncbi:Asp23/Gls24 family envelope stress response protein [Kribbella jejuensis]|uniref:Uncharacterized protein n=1 Tax=Kribbella jejuensis TaxID=236068 RepID=A0A542EA80_9ACTN|nr:Asp23/Gls24 family envelope stress response protein [Kribbella jejuensis]TQJ12235.1 hypothetical protein FB475_5170 [Kribbella jejuensis]
MTDSKHAPERPVPTSVLHDIRYADSVARAARSVPGVVRLQPGVVGLLRQFAAQAWERTTGTQAPDTAGVDVHLTADGHARVDVRIVVDINHQAAEVGAAVHHAATQAITDRPVTARVHIVDIDLEPIPARPPT